MKHIRYRARNGQFISRAKAKRRKHVQTELYDQKNKTLKKVHGYRDRIVLKKPKKVLPRPEPRRRIERRGLEPAELEEFEEREEAEPFSGEDLDTVDEWDDLKGDFPTLDGLDNLDDLDELLGDENAWYD